MNQVFLTGLCVRLYEAGVVSFPEPSEERWDGVPYRIDFSPKDPHAGKGTVDLALATDLGYAAVHLIADGAGVWTGAVHLFSSLDPATEVLVAAADRAVQTRYRNAGSPKEHEGTLAIGVTFDINEATKIRSIHANIGSRLDTIVVVLGPAKGPDVTVIDADYGVISVCCIDEVVAVLCAENRISRETRDRVIAYCR